MIIYRVTNKINDKIYIGKSMRDIGSRKAEHIYGKKTQSSYFHNALCKYGEDNFEWDVIFDSIDSDDSMLNELEIFFIDYYRGYGLKLYNLKSGGNGGLHSDITKIRIGISNKGKRAGKKHSSETIEKMRRPKSEEHRKKIGQSNTGRVVTQVTREKISKRLKGRIVPEDQKKKMRASSKHTKMTDKNKQILMDINKNRIYTKEDNINNSIRQGGKPFLVFNAKTNELIGEWVNKAQCARDLGIDKETIQKGLSMVIKPYKFIFKLKEK